MGAITSTPGLMAMFSGHDHGNTWCYRWDGMLPGMTVKGNGIRKSDFVTYTTPAHFCAHQICALVSTLDMAVMVPGREERGRST